MAVAGGRGGGGAAVVTGAASVVAISAAASVAAILVAPTWAADLALALRVRILPGRTAISVATEVSIDRRFGRGFGFVPGWHYGLYNYGCSYGYPNYYSYSCDLPSTY